MEEWKRENPENEESPQRTKLWQIIRRRELLLALIVTAGVAALLWPAEKDKTAAVSVQSGTMAEGREIPAGDIRQRLTMEVQQILSQIDGIGWVKVCLTLRSDGERTYAINHTEETRENTESGQGGNGIREEKAASVSNDVAVLSGGPLLVENHTPEVAGVLIVAQGASSAVMQQKIVDAVAVLLNISPHRVRVLAGKEEQA